MQYSRKIKKTQKMSNVSPETVVEIQPEHLKKAYKILETYGFSNKEAIEMIDKVYSTNKCDNPLLLVKDALKIFGGM